MSYNQYIEFAKKYGPMDTNAAMPCMGIICSACPVYFDKDVCTFLTISKAVLNSYEKKLKAEYPEYLV